MRVQGIKALRLKYRAKGLKEGQTYLWKVTGYGGGKNKYRDWLKWKTVEVKADTKDEAITKAKELIPAELHNDIKAVQMVTTVKSLPTRTKASRTAVVKVEGPGTDGNYYVCIYGKRGTQSFDKEHFKKKFRDLTAARQYARELATQQYQAFSIQPLQVEDTAA